MIRARYDWSVLTHRIVVMLISQLDMHQETFEMQRVSLRELKELSNVNSNSFYEKMRRVVKTLASQQIEIEEEGEYHVYNLMSDARYVEGEAFVEARFNPNMGPFLLRLKRQFTKYNLKESLQFSRVYTIRFFELIKMMEGIGYYDVPISKLRKMLRLENKYQSFSDFKRYVIDRAQKELKEKSSTYFDYKVIREGRSPVAVKFIIRSKEREIAEPESSPGRVATSEGGSIEEEFEAFLEELPKEEREAWHDQALREAKKANPELDDGDWWLEAMTYNHMRERYREERRD